MLKIPPEIVMERWDSLPQSLRDAIFSEENGEFVWNLGSEIGLSEEQIPVFATLIGDVLRGFMDYSALKKYLSSDLALSEESAASVFEKINDHIFKPMEEDIKNSYSPYIENQASSSTNTDNAAVVSAPTPISQPVSEPVAPISQPVSEPVAPVSQPQPTPEPVVEKVEPPETITPYFAGSSEYPAPIDMDNPPAAAPFVVEEQETIRPVIETDPGAGLSSLRPSFWEGDLSSDENKSVFAKLEFGPKVKKNDGSEEIAKDNVVDLKNLP